MGEGVFHLACLAHTGSAAPPRPALWGWGGASDAPTLGALPEPTMCGPAPCLPLVRDAAVSLGQSCW